jgi:D-aminopeptidase
LLSEVADISLLQEAVESYLPVLQGPFPSVAQLCNNQSGLRDYCALSVLCGADPEGDFSRIDAETLISRARTTHFRPGAQYSYSNGNFRILASMLEEHANHSIGELFSSRIFGPAGMNTACYQPDSKEYAATCIGYDGDTDSGFVPAQNRSYWCGDAGVSASLDDMIAWEQYIDATRDDSGSLYRRLSPPQVFSDGTPSAYGFGLVHARVGGVDTTGHGGTIRGWRVRRIYAPSERLSVVVLFNHHGDAREAAEKLLKAALNYRDSSDTLRNADPTWSGHFIDDMTGLALSLTTSDHSHLSARLLASPEVLHLSEHNVARSATMILSKYGEAIKLQRPLDNIEMSMRAIGGTRNTDVAGRYRCDELDAEFVCDVVGGAAYATFEGYLGRSAAQPMYSVGTDIWLLPCPRSIDSPGPGDWTLIFTRDNQGSVTGIRVGCWLARDLRYSKV